jgi:uncharacterized protein (TIGR02588 family)
MSRSRSKVVERSARTGAEWVTFAVSAALLAALVAVIALQIPGKHTPPAPTVTQSGPVRAAQGSYFVPVEVENRGEATAENVQVLATFTADDGTEVVADQVVDFLAGGEVHELEFVFDEDPSGGKLEFAITGYLVP